jgi:hypothetical protein
MGTNPVAMEKQKLNTERRVKRSALRRIKCPIPVATNAKTQMDESLIRSRMMFVKACPS